MDATRKLMMGKEAELLVDSQHTQTYLMLTCLESEMKDNDPANEGKSAAEVGPLTNGELYCGTGKDKDRFKYLAPPNLDKRSMMYKCALQSQMLSHIFELGKSFGRPPRDIVYRWFEKVAYDADGEKSQAYHVFEQDAEDFARKVKLRAVEKRKEEAIKEVQRRKQEEEWARRNVSQMGKKGEGEGEEDGAELGEDGSGGGSSSSTAGAGGGEAGGEQGEKKYKYIKKVVGKDGKEEIDPNSLVDDEEYVVQEAVPLVVAMKEMSRDQRLEMSRDGKTDPLEVYQNLPPEIKECFDNQDVQALVNAQKVLPIEVFAAHLKQCINAGLWSQPEDDEGEGAEEATESPGDADLDGLLPDPEVEGPSVM